MAIRSKVENGYANTVTNWIKNNTPELLMEEAQNALEDSPMNQRQFTVWAWDLFRISRETARFMYNKIKERGNED